MCSSTTTNISEEICQWSPEEDANGILVRRRVQCHDAQRITNLNAFVENKGKIRNWDWLTNRRKTYKFNMCKV